MVRKKSIITLIFIITFVFLMVFVPLMVFLEHVRGWILLDNSPSGEKLINKIVYLLNPSFPFSASCYLITILILLALYGAKEIKVILMISLIPALTILIIGTLIVYKYSWFL
ncbi:hypothetical protein [Paenibacillus mucilaginosus]|uniref:Uncharacterized protein n=1 Tax=Paenibacillus mucilaginosus (strain KNP414) TaxID=1036673 RepID=F8FJH6_PAEMK|nr:hypothetical protein [Paenibacillus mucilaginosus]AEI42826.1 hypothetical protein KNP414_04294 [Paenibacillus mucilaginosus KNP414]MCG7216461.1 hypothetical protein [Paenibacillus mucilaginosus]WDM31001.1 hypothetical protein KCX80_18425 [Paenibacillus mucilaginosus]